MSVWVECLVSIRFDLDIGPKVEYVTPAGALSEVGKQHLLRVAFPDCNPDCGHDFIFFFTTTDCTAVADTAHSATVADPSHGSAVSKIHGAAYYRQKRDANVPRGYVQQVVVLLSRVPYVVAHELILRVVAPRFAQCCPLSPDTEAVAVSSALSPAPSTFFDLDLSYNPNHYTQRQVLDAAVQEIANWPTPHPRIHYDVMLLHQPLQFTTPSRALRSFTRTQQNAVPRPQMVLDERVRLLDRDVLDATDSSLCSAFMAVPLFGVLGDVLHYMTRLWELVMCHEPICIIANTPSTASAAAVAVASLVLPITFNGALRAYFTVQDEFFGRFSRMGKALPFPEDEGLIVAGTNPFLIRSFEGWPTLLAVSDRHAHSTGSFKGLGTTSPLPPTSTTSSAPSGAASPIGFASPSYSTSSRAEGALSAFCGAGGGAFAGGAPSSPPVTAPASPTMVPSSAVRQAQLSSPSPQSGTDATRSELDSGPDAEFELAQDDAAAMLGLPYGCKVTSTPHSSLSASVSSAGGGGGGGGGDGGGAHRHYTDPASQLRIEVPGSGQVPLANVTRSDPLHASGVYNHDETASTHSHSTSTHASTNGSATASDPHAVLASTHAPLTDGAAAVRDVGPATPASTTARLDTSTLPSSSQRTPHMAPTTAGGEHGIAASPNSSVSSSVFSRADYSALVASRRLAGHSSIAKTNRSASRTKLQHKIRNYFDSSFPFLLDHESLTSALYRRLETVSKMDEGAQRTSAVLLSEQFASPVWNSAASTGVPPPTLSSSRGSHPSTSKAAMQGEEGMTVAVQTSTDGAGAGAQSQFLVADDVVRKFFISLTREFLAPVNVWFSSTAGHISPFQLCDRATADSLLSPDAFLQHFHRHHHDLAPAILKKNHSYKTYKAMYERFAHGKLFLEYTRQLVQEALRTAMSTFQVEEWAARFPSDAERVDIFISLYNVVKRELELCIDPDVILVTTATAVLASMAVFVKEPLREQFMMKVVELRL